MRLVAESPEEEMRLQEAMKLLQDAGYPVHGSSYEEGFLDTMFSVSEHLAGEDFGIYEWSPEQRIRFQEASRFFQKSPIMKQAVSEISHLIASSSLLFREEQKAFQKALEDYVLLKDVLRTAKCLKISGRKGMTGFLEKGIVKGERTGVRTVCGFTDEVSGDYMIQLNSIRATIRSSIEPDGIIFAWNDADFDYTHSFLKQDLEKACAKEQANEKALQGGRRPTLEFMITCAKGDKMRGSSNVERKRVKELSM